MTIEEKRRELFEAGINIRTRTRNEHGDYVLPEVSDRWDGFNAALDAVVIELPGERRVRNGWPEGCGADMAFNDCRELCVDAIESTGLGLKVKS